MFIDQEELQFSDLNLDLIEYKTFPERKYIMVNIIKSTKDIWYNRGDLLQEIGSKLAGTDGAEYTYTIAHTSKNRYTLRCNRLDTPRTGLIRLPGTGKGLSEINDIDNELRRYRRVDDLIQKWDSQTRTQRDIAILTYIIGKMHYKALCREYDVKYYDNSKVSNDSATGTAMFWLLQNGEDDKYIFNKVKNKADLAIQAKQARNANLAMLSEQERIAYEQRIHNRFEILDI
jgi:hypothetical protein